MDTARTTSHPPEIQGTENGGELDRLSGSLLLEMINRKNYKVVGVFIIYLNRFDNLGLLCNKNIISCFKIE